MRELKWIRLTPFVESLFEVCDARLSRVSTGWVALVVLFGLLDFVKRLEMVLEAWRKSDYLE